MKRKEQQRKRGATEEERTGSSRKKGQTKGKNKEMKKESIND